MDDVTRVDVDSKRCSQPNGKFNGFRFEGANESTGWYVRTARFSPDVPDPDCFELNRRSSANLSIERVGDFINRPPLVYHLLRNRILFKSDLGLR